MYMIIYKTKHVLLFKYENKKGFHILKQRHLKTDIPLQNIKLNDTWKTDIAL